jgi:hypothetical protein
MNDRTETELPRWAKLMVENVVPAKTLLRKLRELPILVYCKTEHLCDVLVNARSDSELPTFDKLITENVKLLPTLSNPRTLIPEPIRVYCRKDNAEPNMKKDNTEVRASPRNVDRTLIDEPKLTKSNTEMFKPQPNR